MVQPQRLRVLVVGGGIGGLSAAVALRLQGHEVEVTYKRTLPFPLPFSSLLVLTSRTSLRSSKSRA